MRLEASMPAHSCSTFDSFSRQASQPFPAEGGELCAKSCLSCLSCPGCSPSLLRPLLCLGDASSLSGTRSRCVALFPCLTKAFRLASPNRSPKSGVLRPGSEFLFRFPMPRQSASGSLGQKPAGFVSSRRGRQGLSVMLRLGKEESYCCLVQRSLVSFSDLAGGSVAEGMRTSPG